MNYDVDNYSQGYGQTKEAFRTFTKDDKLQPYLSDKQFRSSNNGNEIGYKLYVFHVRYQTNIESAQPIEVE